MPTLLLRLSGPLQAWGTDSRYAYRQTDRHPSKSGIIGLLAAAQGRRRTDPIEDLAQLRFGIRIDQPGQVERDFHTAQSQDRKRSMPLSHRFYLTDAVFVAGVESEDLEFLRSLEHALQSPSFPLYLGRRSCPPDRPVCLGIVQEPLVEALENAPWQATERYLRRLRSGSKHLEIIYDAIDTTDGFVQDNPLSFDPAHRQYSLRAIQRWEKCMPNPYFKDQKLNAHDPFEGLV